MSKGAHKAAEQLKRLGDEWLKKNPDMIETTINIYGGIESAVEVIDALIFADTDAKKIEAYKAAIRWKDSNS